MSVPTTACCAALLQQQQQTIQRHAHCDQAASNCDETMNHKVMTDQATIEPCSPETKHCTVVEHGRVVVKDILAKATQW